MTAGNERGAKYCQLGDDAKYGCDPEDRLRKGMHELVGVIQLLFAPVLSDFLVVRGLQVVFNSY